MLKNMGNLLVVILKSTDIKTGWVLLEYLCDGLNGRLVVLL